MAPASEFPCSPILSLSVPKSPPILLSDINSSVSVQFTLNAQKMGFAPSLPRLFPSRFSRVHWTTDRLRHRPQSRPAPGPISQKLKSISRQTGLRIALNNSMAASVPSGLFARHRRTMCAGRATKPDSTNSMVASAIAIPTRPVSWFSLRSMSVSVTLCSSARATWPPPTSDSLFREMSSDSTSQSSSKNRSATLSANFAPRSLPDNNTSLTWGRLNKAATVTGPVRGPIRQSLRSMRSRPAHCVESTTVSFRFAALVSKVSPCAASFSSRAASRCRWISSVLHNVNADALSKGWPRKPMSLNAVFFAKPVSAASNSSVSYSIPPKSKAAKTLFPCTIDASMPPDISTAPPRYVVVVKLLPVGSDRSR
mmetsp:Transcript_23684/g.66528  ORF Transcript_23684/g.66528 Transcript_23684/m.66528 type:complete len:368 (-) Transcript_23684:4362-5465(-)